MTEHQSPPAAALPPSAAEPAAGIASSPNETPSMPAASFFEAPIADPASTGIRQWAIEPKQCRWILADEEAGAEALMCGLPAARHRPFCAAHCALAYIPNPPEQEATESGQDAVDQPDPKQQEAK